MVYMFTIHNANYTTMEWVAVIGAELPESQFNVITMTTPCIGRYMLIGRTCHLRQTQVFCHDCGSSGCFHCRGVFNPVIEK